MDDFFDLAMPSPEHDLPFPPTALRPKDLVEPTRRILPGAIANLSEDDQNLFEIFGCGPCIAPRFSLIHDGFLHFAARQPKEAAIIHEGRAVSYGELDAASADLAAYLRRIGIGAGDAVGLYLERGVPMVVGILAVLRVGAAYVPQHVGVATDEMLRHISNVTKARVVLTTERLLAQVPVLEGQDVFAIDAPLPPVKSLAGAVGSREASPNDPCFILFTSGTTGQPNGVIVTHRNVCNILQTGPGDLGIRPGLRVAQMLSISFDMAAWEILGCLSNGGTLVIRGKSFQDAAEMVDILIATPSILNRIDVDRCKHIRTVAVAGEPCPRPLADKWSAICRFHNSCGPTETTIINTAEQHFPAKPILSIGRPTPNNTVYVLDDAMQPCAIGEPGEMWAGGDCVTAGYLGNPGLTAERYHPDPFLGGGRMMFRTRDLGRWTSGGELEHLGRVDDQVKIRGFRVELDAVSARIETVPECAQAVTLKLDDRTLVSFASPIDVDIQAARQAVADALPYYCVPAQVLPLPEFPRTPRGKIDKRRLREMAEKMVCRGGAE